MSDDIQREPGAPSPFLVAFPNDEDEGGGQRIMLDPGYFHGLDEVGMFIADLTRHYARAFVQSGRARDESDAVSLIRSMFEFELDESDDPY